MLFFPFLNYLFILLILAIIAQMFNPIVELIIPLEISTKEAKSEMDIHTVTVKAKIRRC